MPTGLAKIVSGGQTGADRGALDAALDLGFPCGGWCPKGRLAEDGTIPDRYPLTESSESVYHRRTLQNVLDSDGTAILHFGEIEGGTEQTLRYCIRHRKPCKLLDGDRVDADRAAVVLAGFVRSHGIGTLNVAGPRASEEPRAHGYAEAVVGKLLASLAY